MKTKMKNKFLYSAIIAASLAIVGCSKEDDVVIDNTKPTIEDISLAHGTNTVTAGKELCIEMEVADNAGLSYLKIDMHHSISCGDVEHDSKSTGSISAFTRADDHDHNHGSSWEMIEDADGFHSVNKTIDLDGLKNSHIHQHVSIPSDAYNGEYHIVIYLVDAEGNQMNVAEEVEVTGGRTYGEDDHDHDDDHSNIIIGSDHIHLGDEVSVQVKRPAESKHFTVTLSKDDYSKVLLEQTNWTVKDGEMESFKITIPTDLTGDGSGYTLKVTYDHGDHDHSYTTPIEFHIGGHDH